MRAGAGVPPAAAMEAGSAIPKAMHAPPRVAGRASRGAAEAAPARAQGATRMTIAVAAVAAAVAAGTVIRAAIPRPLGTGTSVRVDAWR